MSKTIIVITVTFIFPYLAQSAGEVEYITRISSEV